MMPEERQQKDDWNRYSEKPKQGTTTEAHCYLRYVRVRLETLHVLKGSNRPITERRRITVYNCCG
jgi:hypothetical protein